MLFSPSLLRQMEIISFSHSPHSLRSVRSKPQALFVLPFSLIPSAVCPSLTVSVHLPLHRFISKGFKLQQNLTTLTSTSSLLSEVVTGVMTHASLDRRNWWEAIRLCWSWSEWEGLHHCIPPLLDKETWTPAALHTCVRCTISLDTYTVTAYVWRKFCAVCNQLGEVNIYC